MKISTTHALSLIAGLVITATATHAAGVLTAKNGMTLYVFDKDTGGVSLML